MRRHFEGWQFWITDLLWWLLGVITGACFGMAIGKWML